MRSLKQRMLHALRRQKKEEWLEKERLAASHLPSNDCGSGTCASPAAARKALPKQKATCAALVSGAAGRPFLPYQQTQLTLTTDL